MKCDNCLNARRVISENGLHSLCCLSEKVAMDCLVGKKDQRIIIPRSNEKIAESQESDKVCNDCYYNDGEVHAECVICDKAESEVGYEGN